MPKALLNIADYAIPCKNSTKVLKPIKYKDNQFYHSKLYFIQLSFGKTQDFFFNFGKTRLDFDDVAICRGNELHIF